MKRLVTSFSALFLFLVFGAVYYYTSNPMETDENQVTSAGDGQETEDLIQVGLIQFISHDSLDAISQGAIDALSDYDYVDEETISLDLQNGQGDQSNLGSISTQFVNDEMDLIIAVATPAAQAAANATDQIPIVLAGITDPEAAGLVASNEQPETNVSGVSDMTPVAEQLELIRQLHPEAEKLGVIYASSEVNGQIQADLAEELAADYGFTPVIQTVSSTNDVNQVSQQLAEEVDVMWIPNDNIVASAFPTVIENASAAGVAVYPAVDIMVAQGGLATIGINQYQLGYQAGMMAVRVLQDGTDLSTTPVEQASQFDLVINFEQAERLNVDIPDEMVEEAIDAASLESGDD